MIGKLVFFMHTFITALWTISEKFASVSCELQMLFENLIMVKSHEYDFKYLVFYIGCAIKSFRQTFLWENYLQTECVYYTIILSFLRDTVGNVNASTFRVYKNIRMLFMRGVYYSLPIPIIRLYYIYIYMSLVITRYLRQ